MSVEQLAVVFHHSQAKGTAKLVLLGIANHAGDGGAWPSIGTLARYANVTDRNVQKAITALVAKGELAVYEQQGGTAATPEHRRTNRYDVLVSCPSWCDRSTNHRDTRARQQLFPEGVSDATPVGTSDATPGRVSDATPKPSLEPTPPKPPPPLDPAEVARRQAAALEAAARMRV